MKKIILMASILFFLQKEIIAQKQSTQKIKELDSLEMNAIFKTDTITLLKLWDKNYVVNNPYGNIVTVPKILGFMRSGTIDYSSVSRIVEQVTFNNNIAISMGKEILVPKGLTPDATGKTIVYRYTHIWMYKNKNWLLVARQATSFL